MFQLIQSCTLRLTILRQKRWSLLPGYLIHWSEISCHELTATVFTGFWTITDGTTPLPIFLLTPFREAVFLSFCTYPATPLSRDVVLAGGFGGTRGLSVGICLFTLVRLVSFGDSFHETVFFALFAPTRTCLCEICRAPVVFVFWSFVRLDDGCPLRWRGPLLRCALRSMSLSELSVLSELNEGVLRLFASDRDLAGVPALSSLAVLFSSLAVFIFILFIFFNSSLGVPEVGRLPDVESVRAGEWERDDDAEWYVSTWRTWRLGPAQWRQNTKQHSDCVGRGAKFFFFETAAL